MRYGQFLLAVALATAVPATAQELQLDPKALDASGAPTQRKAKKTEAKTDKQRSSQTQTPSKSGGDRQFGELEGWSPGKSPPKPKDKEPDPFSNPSHGPMSVTPSGNVGVGLPF